MVHFNNNFVSATLSFSIATTSVMCSVGPAAAQQAPPFLNQVPATPNFAFLEAGPQDPPNATTQGIPSAASQGDASHQSYNTGEGPRAEPVTFSNLTTEQNGNGMNLPLTRNAVLSPGPGLGPGLPPTSLDSFVTNAGGQAELIYGDEGTDSIPPYFEFDQTHRIIRGINGIDYQGLTTGHGSMLPNAWGGDEFVKTEPFTFSGP
jgi:hypothetical protein